MKNLVLLHGALGAASQFESIVKELEPHFNLWIPDLPMHGQNAHTTELTMSDFSLDLLHQIEAKSWQKVSVFGYSMGGYLALMMASQKSELFDKIVTLGTKLDWNEEIGKAQSMILNPDVMESKVPKYTAYLDSLHTAFSWREVVHATAKLLVDLGANPPLKPEVLQQVQTSCVLCLGDEDKMVTEAESRMACSNLVDARFRILEHTPHPLEKVNSQVLIDLLLTEFTT